MFPGGRLPLLGQESGGSPLPRRPQQQQQRPNSIARSLALSGNSASLARQGLAGVEPSRSSRPPASLPHIRRGHTAGVPCHPGQ